LKLKCWKSFTRPGGREFDWDSFEKHDKFQMYGYGFYVFATTFAKSQLCLKLLFYLLKTMKTM